MIVGGARTPMCEYVGTPGFGKFKDVSAIDLAAHASKAALARSKVDPSSIDHVVMGNALQTSVDAIYGARHVGLKAGVPKDNGALTVNRLCGSGIQSIVNGAQMILLGEARTVLAGGMENMSQAPYVLYGARQGFAFGQAPQMQDSLFAALTDPLAGLMMAQTAEKIAKRLGITREEQDEYALRSHQLGAAAVKEGRFAAEIEPVTIKGRKGDETVALDDHIKPETTLEGLSKLRAAFGKDGTVTAGNASGIVDGAAAVVLTTAERAKADASTCGRDPRLGLRRRRSDRDGHRPGACDPELPRSRPASRSTRSTSSRSTRPSRRSTWAARRSSSSTATSATSTAERSRSATRSARRARASC